MIAVRIAPLLLLVICTPALAQDVTGAGDHSLLPRYPGSEICASTAAEYGEYKLVSGPASNRDNIPTRSLEGRILRNMYVLKDEQRSVLEVMRNYQIALEEGGFTEIYACGGDDCAEGADYRTFYFFRANPNLRLSCKVPDNADWSMPQKEPRYFSAHLARPQEGDVHVAVTVAAWHLRGGSGPRYVFIQADVVEAEPMQVGMELKLAEEIGQDLAASGRAILYGIHFETDSTAILPDSELALQEIAKLLNGRPDLELLVVGHTDDEGALEYNLNLSSRRARAVVDALVNTHGIARERLEGHGVAYLAPVATNITDEGRALNRRVELVERR
jgi:outer membrane protein OmpA-like peptidoglycan-associated protein